MTDPFATIGDHDPGAVGAEEHSLEVSHSYDHSPPLENRGEYKGSRKLAQKPLSNEALRLPLHEGRPKLSDYAQSGKYTPLAQLEGRILTIQQTEMIDTKYGEALQMSLSDEDGTVHQVCTSSTNIVEAFTAFNEAVAEGQAEYPIVSVFRKIALQGGNTCWTICDE